MDDGTEGLSLACFVLSENWYDSIVFYLFFSLILIHKFQTVICQKRFFQKLFQK